MPSFGNRYIAASTDNGYILAFTYDFTLVHTFESEIKLPPESLAWVGNEAIVAFWDCLLLIPIESSSSQNQTEIYGYSQPLFLVPEIDGLRIISSEKNEFLQVVPKPLKVNRF